jgi:hypothetical protein
MRQQPANPRSPPEVQAEASERRTCQQRQPQWGLHIDDLVVRGKPARYVCAKFEIGLPMEAKILPLWAMVSISDRGQGDGERNLDLKLAVRGCAEATAVARRPCATRASCLGWPILAK